MRGPPPVCGWKNPGGSLLGHVRRKFYDIAVADASPIAIEAVQRIGALHDIEREIHGQLPVVRQTARQARAGAIRYALPRWPALTRYVDDGLIEIDNNAAERAAVIYSLIGTAKLNDINPQAYLTWVLERIADHPISKIDELLPWNLDLSEGEGS